MCPNFENRKKCHINPPYNSTYKVKASRPARWQNGSMYCMFEWSQDPDIGGIWGVTLQWAVVGGLFFS